jgi:hypothetical protein
MALCREPRIGILLASLSFKLSSSWHGAIKAGILAKYKTDALVLITDAGRVYSSKYEINLLYPRIIEFCQFY